MKNYNKLFNKLTESFNNILENSSRITSKIDSEITSNLEEINKLSTRNKEIYDLKLRFDKLINGINKLIGND